MSEGAKPLARRLLERTVKEAPSHDGVHRAQLLLGRLLVAEGETSSGVSHLESAVRKWPALREGWVDTARAHTELKDYVQATRYLKQGRHLFPGDPVLLSLEDQMQREMADLE